MKVVYTPSFRSDLHELERYITDVLDNPFAAERIVSHILRYSDSLGQMPYMGLSLSSKIQADTDLRYIICEKRLIIYRINENEIHVLRILDGRTDYVRQLF